MRDGGFVLGEDTIRFLLEISGEKPEMLCDDDKFNGVGLFANCEKQTVELQQLGLFLSIGLIGVKSEVQLIKVEDAIVVFLMELCLCVCGVDKRIWGFLSFVLYVSLASYILNGCDKVILNWSKVGLVSKHS